ncbi:MAG: hemolysin III family protein, partial [Myxococcales bacterium]|nr:hemolysin III family protein [Myxococcales bacterium]
MARRDRSVHPSIGYIPRHERPLLRGVPCVVATALALPATIALLRAAQPGESTVAAIIYSVTLLMLLGVSAVYHTPAWLPDTHRMLQRIDHGNIYLAIAGSYTPLGLALHEPARTVALTFVWVGAVAGALEAWVFTGMRREARATIYCVLGLSTALSSGAVLEACGPSILFRYLFGGGLYVVGASFYALRRPDPWPRVFGHHELFHVFVMIAAVIHYTVIWDLL